MVDIIGFFFNTSESHRVTVYLQNAYKNKNFKKKILTTSVKTEQLKTTEGRSRP